MRLKNGEETTQSLPPPPHQLSNLLLRRLRPSNRKEFILSRHKSFE